MILPTENQLFSVLECTWPAVVKYSVGHCTIREGRSGGKRVSAATLDGSTIDDIERCEAEMTRLKQPALFMVRQGQDTLDTALERRGYQVIDRVSFYACPISLLTKIAVPSTTAFAVWPPLAITREIWAQGDIRAGRLAVMERVQNPKTSLLMRRGDRAAGAAFVAIERQTAMIHAIEVAKSQRQQGVAANMMRAAAHWAQDHDARFLALAVTDSNSAANALYLKLGLTVVGHYHYRLRKGTTRSEAKIDQY